MVYPTSTLPGLGCLPNKQALDNLYALKKRPAHQPVSLGVASLEQAKPLVEIPRIAEDVLQAFPTGSLTLILDAVGTLDARLGGDRVAPGTIFSFIASKVRLATWPASFQYFSDNSSSMFPRRCEVLRPLS